MERRDQQNLTLTPNTHPACNGGIGEHKPDTPSVSRWVRLGSRNEPKQVLKSRMREIRTCGSVRVLPSAIRLEVVLLGSARLSVSKQLRHSS